MRLDDNALVDGAVAALEGLLNGVWQGIVIVAMIAMSIRFLKGAGATARHLIWLGALGAVVGLTVLPASDWLVQRQASVLQPELQTVDLVQSLPSTAPSTSSIPGTPPISSTSGFTLEVPRAEWLLIIVSLLLAGSVLRLMRLVSGFGRWSSLRAKAGPFPAELMDVVEDLPEEYFRRRPVVLLSDELSRPITMGFLNPTILLPRSISEDLSALELKQVVLHELAHVRRYDDWTNLFQRLLESMFYFNPVVGWIGRILETEREIACDEQVVARLGERSGYASFLIRLAESTCPVRGGQYVAGVASTTNQLAHRVKAILTRGEPMREWQPALAIGAGAAVLALALVITSNGPAINLALAEEVEFPGFVGGAQSVDTISEAPAHAATPAINTEVAQGPESGLAVQAAASGTASSAVTEKPTAQAIVSGRVTTAEAAPLSGVMVTLQGTTISALTNATGNYTIEIPSTSGRLVFSSAGYATRTVPIEGRTVINVVLETPGTSVLLDTLEPEPLYVIDGVSATAAEFNRLDPSQIESISILKDASAAVYGDRAAYGVVLVVTKAASAARERAPITREYMERAAAIAPFCRSCEGAVQQLYVIDGVPASLVEFNRLGPEDIETISVLKDAAAAAYGEQGAKGVVLVTTRRDR